MLRNGIDLPICVGVRQLSPIGQHLARRPRPLDNAFGWCAQRKGPAPLECQGTGPSITQRNPRRELYGWLGFFFGRITASITWITPFLHAMSALTTFAPSIETTPSLTLIFTFDP